MRLIAKDWISSINYAMAFNMRGGVGIVLSSIAFDYGIINETFFVTLVICAIFTALISGL
ncbi:MAG: hypothetical protein NC817_01715 [Candidatus Omnitrophica bacterium]|nr:hypothetical protein [Candidatus Omnitrophota bacterium]MCM8824070.1 hypothetical protein [Candidatus Omnitrophota bacterium]MCM8827050.1 hypothetical protein [Candidatus Omnitrophota bacterium]